MLYRAFLVEDEIVTREGIRDNVDWRGNGFVFCGEAPDGEIALPLLQTARPDLLITDIRMPFMDGLQLARVVRQRMPWVKIIILSGHDEFEYAQEAIKLGVSEYLLKPVSVQDLHDVLRRMAAQLDQERKEREDLQRLRDEVEENREALRQRLLLKLVVGAASSAEAVEESQRLGMELAARCYLVAVVKVALDASAEPFAYREYCQAQGIVSGLATASPHLFVLEKGIGEFILIVRGDAPDPLREEARAHLEAIRRELRAARCRCTVAAGIGGVREHLGELSESFVEALVDLQATSRAKRSGPGERSEKAELLKIDRAAADHYLRSGAHEDFDRFFDSFVSPLGEAAFQSPIVRDYILLDIILAAARCVSDLGGDIDRVIPELNHLEAVLESAATASQVREQARRTVASALAFRDGQTRSPHAATVQRAREYIDSHYADPDLSLQQVAAHVGLSPSHFSTVFSQESSTTFKEYLTEVRIRKAKELLRTTALQSSEVSYRVGYNDPHYFSYVFRKNTGLSPTEFRWRALGSRAERGPDPDATGDGLQAAGGQDDRDHAHCR